MEKRKAKKLYVAYGSNLNLQQMKYRCPSAKLVGSGFIKNYELDFRGNKFCAYATILPRTGGQVPAAVWEIGLEDEKRLDMYEGYPSHYFKKEIAVMLGEEPVNAMVYIMDLKMEPGLPSWEYYFGILEGYMDCGLDTNYLDNTLSKSLSQSYNSNGIALNEEKAKETEHETANEIRM